MWNHLGYGHVIGIFAFSFLFFQYPLALVTVMSSFHQIGDRVCVKRSVAEPRCAWGGETHHSVGRISEIENDGLLIIEIPNRPIPWQADPSDMEKVEDFKVIPWSV